MADDLLVIIPTRGRPQAVPEIVQAWDDTGATADVLFAVDTDDPELAAYKKHAAALKSDGRVRFTFGKRRRLCGTLNQQALKAANQYRFLGFMGDDHRPRPADRPWDARIRECLSGGPGIVYGNDLLMGERMPTAVAMTSDIVSTLGYFAPPVLTHLCLDLCWLDWGRGMGRITYLDDMVIEHLHPAAGKAELDQGYEEANSSEQVSADSAAYYEYRDGGGLEADLDKLRKLVAYSHGGTLIPGQSVAVNTSGEPETVVKGT
ncbi:glycosyltransferase family 2 protein [Streptomyces sparsogenes]|uniref:Pas34 n=1 Tax=Streptomyces sparsogenes DSM 40356 TaxID=1331668 RepID=A0A1R1S836_9ACTN|nr:glycosyltransferase family A protein [Streptomyces sparsogenes]OMI34393.1 Pas34 [Streptomyces sparsogenes DSM 40356]